MESFFEAPDVAEVASSLINSIPEHSALRGVKIAYLFTDKKQKDGATDKIDWAYAKLVPKELRASDDSMPWFIIVVNQYVWQELDETERKALIDHELCHCQIKINKDGYRMPSMKNHDYSDFGGVIARYGAWSPSLKEWSKHIKAEQLDLFEKTAVQEEVEL